MTFSDLMSAGLADALGTIPTATCLLWPGEGAAVELPCLYNPQSVTDTLQPGGAIVRTLARITLTAEAVEALPQIPKAQQTLRINGTTFRITSVIHAPQDSAYNLIAISCT